MFKSLTIASLLFSLAALADVQTTRIASLTNGDLAYYTTMNGGASTAAVIARNTDPQLVNCGLGGNLNTSASFVLNDNLGYPYNTTTDQNDTMNIKLASFTYPQNVAVTKITFRVCYVINGYVQNTSTLTPIVRQKSTGIVYKAGTAIVTASSGFFSGVNVFDITPVQSATVELTFAALGAPDISSMSAGDFEVGFAARGRSITTMHIFGVDFRANFAAFTTAPLSLLNPTWTYKPATPWNNGRVGVDLNMGAPSSGTGVQVDIKCAGGQYYAFSSLPWGVGSNGTAVSLSTTLANVNATSCSGHALTQGSSTTFRIQPTNGAPYGNFSYSFPVNLN